MEALVTAGAGFLLAVLWIDLMHDVQVRPHDLNRDLPEPVLDSIAAYYARVTTDARPMNRLIAFVMAATLAAIVVQLVGDYALPWVAWMSLALTALAVGLAAGRTVKAAVRLGTREDDPDLQSRLARNILGDHMICFAAMSIVLTIQVWSAVN